MYGSIFVHFDLFLFCLVFAFLFFCVLCGFVLLGILESEREMELMNERRMGGGMSKNEWEGEGEMKCEKWNVTTVG